MNRFAIPLVGFLLLVVLFAVTLKHVPDREVVPSALIGRAAPQFELPDLLAQEQQVSNGAYAGKWYLLNVWGTWCVECRAEHPTLLQIQKTGKVQIVGLNYKDEPDEARAWLAQLGNPYASVPEDREGRVAIDWGVYGAPETFLVNPQGVVVEKIVGVVTPENWATRLLPHIEGRSR
ncbi:MAG: DsbE family thiol:disulfide interchange protein [Steroidobacteraceae bacterium]